jgi:hypothetical protein
MKCVIFWVVLWRMVFNSLRFRTLCLFDLYTQVDEKFVRVEICGVANRYRLTKYPAGGGGGVASAQLTQTNTLVAGRIAQSV